MGGNQTDTALLLLLIEESNAAADIAWMLSTAYIVMTMQAGFAMLESGLISIKSAGNILAKNVMDIGAAGIGYFAIGRMKFKVYLVYALVISSVIYSVPSHWVWDSSGWLYAMGMHDLAGCSAIHSVGGVCGLLSTIWLGPRLGTFTQDEKGNNVYWPTRSSPTQVCYGTFLLWSGWMAFNSGSVLGVSNGLAYAAARAGVNTILGSVGGSIGGLVFTTIASRNKYVDIVELCTGLLSGLVAVTAACDIIRPWEAVLVGMIGGLVANGIGGVLVRFGIDDPVGVVGVHLVAGAFGTVVPGLFGSKGVFVTGSFTQLGVQVLGLVAMLGWTLATSALFLFVVDLSVGLRVPAHHERIGLDQTEHNMVLIRLHDEDASDHSDYDSDGTDLERGGLPPVKEEQVADKLLGGELLEPLESQAAAAIPVIAYPAGVTDPAKTTNPVDPTVASQENKAVPNSGNIQHSASRRKRKTGGRRSSVQRVAAQELYVSSAMAANPEGLISAMEAGRAAARASMRQIQAATSPVEVSETSYDAPLS
ncbi:hypothetical protein FNF27_00227 [Cafeteria roenbergensis]|uniref:Ammonium transporter AmtB-like domain-containing protein n=1 Tax=Cafeteria roenbergensis TaxID=33653 RepID=A0A5A8ENX9_CAFRO|nr:hypothetical protein FNF27_00227 [Cafeteria roenbergensis]